MRFLIDAQLPPRLARRLADHGHEASHVADLGLAGASDATVWSIAIERAAILVTKDQDFAIARAVSDEGPAIIWIRIGNTPNEVLIARRGSLRLILRSRAQRGVSKDRRPLGLMVRDAPLPQRSSA